MKKFKCILSMVLVVALLIGAFPVYAFADASLEIYSVSNGYIKADVSTKNGGFVINTVEGNQLKKSDNNKRLLYHNGDYDTSFISFRVTDASGIHDYIFGGIYGDSADASRSGVNVSQPGGENSPIKAVWGTGNLTFTVTISLANSTSDEYGMVSISVKAENAGTDAVDIKTRILYDTCLGDQDYGYYQLSDGTENYTYKTETILDSSQTAIPQNFYAADSVGTTNIAAYSANGTGNVPYRIAMGHWNNLAASLFDFTPAASLDFTDPINEFLTADSAYALYFDMGTIASGGSDDLTTFYGVFANSNVSVDERVAINVTAQSRLEHNAAKDGFEINGPGLTNLQLGVTFENYEQEGASEISSCSLVVSSTNNLRPLETEDGQPLNGYDYDTSDPLVVAYTNVGVGKQISKTLNFQARLVDNASYERLTISVYDTSSTGGQLAQENLLGTKTIYVLLPASDGSLPKVGFVDMSPKEIYKDGVRHLYVSLTNSNIMADRSNWNIYAENMSTSIRVPIDNKSVTFRDDVMDVVIGEEINLAEDTWQLKLEWTDDAVSAGIAQDEYKTQTADCLMFSVSDNPELKNNSYGIAAVVRFDVPSSGSTKKTPTYRLKLFEDEAALTAYNTAKWEDGDPVNSNNEHVEFHSVLLTFRGEFTVEESYTSYRQGVGVEVPTKISAVSTKTVDSTTRKTTVTNCVTINSCLDFENGKMSIYYDGSPTADAMLDTHSVKVEFDGDLLTSDARTSVWSGKACFTEFEQGEAFSLQPYDGNERDNDGRSNENNITLVWPAAAGIGQTLAGMIFNLAFGEMGVVYDNDEFVGYVVAFAANLDLSFAGPQSSGNPSSSYWREFTDYWSTYRVSQSSSIWGMIDNSSFKDKMLKSETFEEYEDERTSLECSVMVPDVLFGCGEGFYGVHFTVSVGMENFSDQLPSLEGELEVNTIGDWGFGFEGGMECELFETEFKLSFKSHNDIPIPDEIYFYLGGFEPGVNIDGFGILWITGGGGGFSDLYDTVMCVQKVPPLKLILTLSFSIMQVLDGKATLSLGATGFSLEAEDLKILKEIDAIDHVNIEFEWWPGIDFKGSFGANLFGGIISGGGYIVVIGEDYSDWMFEMFLRAAVSIPEDIPLVGGMKVAGADLGVSNEKIWGAVQVVQTSLGVTYYWGENSVDFGVGSQTEPTFPELLGYDDVPVYYDEERDDTLYMRIGTNIESITTAEIEDDSEMKLMAYPNAPYIRSNLERTSHEFKLAADSNDTIVQLVYDANTSAEAISIGKTFTVKKEGNIANLVFFDASANGGAGNAQSCNANITWNSETKKATFAFTVTDSADMNKVWTISTGTAKCEAALYGLSPVANVTDVSVNKAAYNAGESIEISCTGTTIDMDSLMSYQDSFRFYLTSTYSVTEAGIAIETEDSNYSNKSEWTATLRRYAYKIPESVPSGNYYVKCVYTDGNIVNGSMVSTSPISVTNSRTPGNVSLSELKNKGNSQIGLNVTIGNNTDGVIATIYEYNTSNGGYTQVLDTVSFDAQSGSSEIAVSVGGSYTYNNVFYGLEAGKTYAVGIKPYKEVDNDGDGTMDALIYGTELRSSNAVLSEATVPTFAVSSDKTPVSLTKTSTNGSSYQQDAFTENDISFSFNAKCSENNSSAEIVTGNWSLDGATAADGNYGTFDSQSIITANLSDITDGDHTITLTGEDKQGDSFSYSYTFTVDTQAPKLVVSSPLNGDYYDATGKITLKMITDRDATVNISCDGKTVKSGKANQIGSFDASGVFTADITVSDVNSSISKEFTVTATDAVGNSISHTSRIYRGGMAGIRSVAVAADGQVFSDGVLIGNPDAAATHQLDLMGVLEDGTMVSLSTLPNINWAVTVAEGSASVDDNGLLSLSANAKGFVTGSLEISSGAYLRYTLIFGETADDKLVRVISSIGGTVTGAGKYNAGDTVTVTATPSAGYSFAGWTVSGVSIADKSASTVTFTMPDSGNVTLTANFSKNSYDDSYDDSSDYSGDKIVKSNVPAGTDTSRYVPCYYDSNGKLIPIIFSSVIDGKLVYRNLNRSVVYKTSDVTFTDVVGTWGMDDVNFLAARGIINGVGNNKFDPYTSMNRSSFVTTLYRLSGSPNVTDKTSYADVDSDAWYADAVSWATSMGIVGGVGGGKFDPNSPVTREQMCSMIIRYLNAYGYKVNKAYDAKEFGDSARISDWAEDDVDLCTELGIIFGKDDGNFAPLDKASRMECCAVIRRLITSVLEGMM